VPRGSGRSAKRAAAAQALKAGDDDAVAPPIGEHVEDGYVVRHVSGAASAKSYRCPGCDHELRPATAHVVAWPEGRPDDRRHWHAACWAARDRRGVKVHRSKNAPRYG
jgi:hypothetical protein